MYCPNNYYGCRERGYCDCHDTATAETAEGCGGLLFLMVVGIIAGFLYPAIRIFRSDIEYYPNNDTPKFAGVVWLLTSPLFGFLSGMLYQTVFAMGACAAEATNIKITNYIYATGFFAIYALAMGLAVIAFLIKNRTAIQMLVIEPATLSIGKIASLIGLAVITFLAFCAVLGVLYMAAQGYFHLKYGFQNTVENEKAKIKIYEGKYKYTTRNQKAAKLKESGVHLQKFISKQKIIK